MSLHADTVDVLRAWTAPEPAQDQLRTDYLGFLAEHGDGVWRSCVAGHVTASALVLDPAGRVLLTLHPKAGRWFQLGGHLEPGDRSLRAAAAREAREESGIDGLRLLAAPARLDRHQIRCRPDLVLDHLDVQYVALAPPGAQAVCSPESLDLKWFAVDALPESTDDSVRALVERALALS